MYTNISHKEVHRMAANGARVVEVLPEKQYQKAHIAGAINLPLKELRKEASIRLERDQPVIVYCASYQ